MPASARKSTPARNKAIENPPPTSTVEVSPVSAWKKVDQDTVTLPSGHVIRMRNVGFQAFIKAGIIPNSLMSTVQQSVNSGVEPTVDDLQAEDESLTDMFDLVDEVTIFCWIDPPVSHLPQKDNGEGVKVDAPELKQDDILYVDEISDEDKMFTFNVTVGGTRDVEQFRREQTNSVAAL